eukprot:GHVS01021657.1.p1 GENE.GHVS01021657.1~~GHVS01021657.1.p1  ORF type:complete len:514 (+),score=75.55 GHVS01021657.1:166-1707(+)
MSEFKRLQILPDPPTKLEEKNVNRLWKKYKVPLRDQETSSISCVAFLPVAPFDCLVASSTKVLLYDVTAGSVRKRFSMFKAPVKSVAFRSDGRLLCVGDGVGKIRIMEVLTKEVLRRLKGHSSAVHACGFSPDKVHILSGGDDSRVMYWDVTDGRKLAEFSGHCDSVRSLCHLENGGWATGSYDGTVKVWDERINMAAEPEEGRKTRKCQALFTLEQGDAVERVYSLPGSSQILTAAGPTVKLWDLSGGSSGKEVWSMTNHMKTVTDIAVTSDSKMLVTASLDESVKWHDMESRKVLHTFRAPAPACCLALSPHDEAFITGTSDGSWTLRRRIDAEEVLLGDAAAASARQCVIKAGVADYFKKRKQLQVKEADQTAEGCQRVRLGRIDRMLRSFQYQAALDSALRQSDMHTLSVLEELIQRKALYVALRNRNDRESLVPILAFLQRNIGKDSTYAHILLDALHIILEENDWSKCTTDPLIMEALRQIGAEISGELSQLRSLRKVEGVLDMMMS